MFDSHKFKPDDDEKIVEITPETQSEGVDPDEKGESLNEDKKD